MKTIIKDIQIRAIAAWLPKERAEIISYSPLYGEATVNSIIKATGIEEVRTASVGQTASDMCFNAAEYLISQENINVENIDGLIFVSQTSDYILPATSIILQDRLRLKKDTVCIDIHYGCSGYIYGVLQAACWINSGLCKNVLVLAGDTTSRLINPLDKSLRLVFGDCGTASLICSGNHRFGFDIMSDGSGFDKLIVPAGGFRLPCSQKTSEIKFDEDGNGRTLNDLYMDGSAIFNFAISKVPQNIKNTVKLMNWELEDVDRFILHQANDFMVNYIRKKLKVTPDRVPTNVRLYGNTGPATIPLLCSDLFSRQSEKLEKVVMSGFGVGLSWGSIGLCLSDTKFYNPLN